MRSEHDASKKKYKTEKPTKFEWAHERKAKENRATEETDEEGAGVKENFVV